MTSFAPEMDFPETRQYRHLDTFLVLICMIIIPSAVIQSLLGLDERSSFAIFAPIAVSAALLLNRFKVATSIPLIISMMAIIGGFASLVAGAFSQLLMAATFALATIIGHALYVSLSKPKVLRAVTWFTLAMSIGGIGGIVYSLFGGQPLLDVQVGYRTTSLYLTTFSFATIGNIIRPAGIFDEPGALSMYVAIVTMFNDTLGQNRKLNLILIALMIFTGSLAGVVVAVLYIALSNAMRSSQRKRFALVATFAGAVLLMQILFPTNLVTTTLDTFYTERFKLVDGRLSGDNRTNQIEEFFALVDSKILLVGERNSTNNYDTYDISSNPFSITFGYGLLISIPYFFMLIWMVWMAISNRFQNSYSSLGLVSLLVQRPYIYNMSWSILIVSVIWLLHYNGPRRRG